MTTPNLQPVDPDGHPIQLTNNGLNAALNFVAGCYPTQEQTPELINTWRTRLGRYTDDTVMQAVWQLSERNNRFRMDVGDIYVTCRTITNQRHIATATQTRNARQLETTTDRRTWHQLTPTEQQARVDALPPPHNAYADAPTCQTCPAVLVGYDPTPHCRHCAKRKR